MQTSTGPVVPLGALFRLARSERGHPPRTWMLYSDWLDLKGGTHPGRTSSKEISVDRTTSVLSNVQPIVPISDRLSVVLGVNLFSRSLFVILIEEVT